MNQLLKIVYGNRHRLVPDAKRLSKSGIINNHEWTMFVKLKGTDINPNVVIEKENVVCACVRFIHSSARQQSSFYFGKLRNHRT